MTGALLGGSSVEQAARLQMIIMFMISSSTAISSIIATTTTLGIVVDGEHRIRIDRIDVRPHAVWRARDRAVAKVVEELRESFYTVMDAVRHQRRHWASLDLVSDDDAGSERLLP